MLVSLDQINESAARFDKPSIAEKALRRSRGIVEIESEEALRNLVGEAFTPKAPVV